MIDSRRPRRARERGGVEVGAGGVGAERGRGGARGLPDYGRQRPRVDEGDHGPVVEGERRPRVGRERIRGRADVPVAVHAKVRVQHAAVVEPDELVLADALDAGDEPTHEPLGDVVGEGAAGDRVVGAQRVQAPTDDRGAEAPDRGLDFRQLGHVRVYGMTGGRRDRRAGAPPHVRCVARPPT